MQKNCGLNRFKGAPNLILGPELLIKTVNVKYKLTQKHRGLKIGSNTRKNMFILLPFNF